MLTFLAFSACHQKEEVLVEADPIDTEASLRKQECPQETVHIHNLANWSTSISGRCTGQLHDVWRDCFNGGIIGRGCTLVGTLHLTPSPIILSSLITLANPPLVTYDEQEQIIFALLDMAQTIAPTCSLGQRANVVDLNFCRDGGGPNDLLLTVKATYACCLR